MEMINYKSYIIIVYVSDLLVMSWNKVPHYNRWFVVYLVCRGNVNLQWFSANIFAFVHFRDDTWSVAVVWWT